MNHKTLRESATPRHTEADEANIRTLVEAFYRRVDDDPLLGPTLRVSSRAAGTSISRR